MSSTREINILTCAFFIKFLLADLSFEIEKSFKKCSSSLDTVPFLFIFKGVNQIDNDLKARASAYNNLKGNLQNLERKNA